MPDAGRVLVVAPHPDDESIGCGGALAAHVADGAEVHALFLTSGEAGHPKIPADVLGPQREAEAQAAADVLGLASVEFWRVPDGRLRAGEVLVDRMAATLRAHRPAVVYVTHPGELHADHRAAARLVRRAAGRVDRAPELRGYEVWTPIHQLDHVIDIGEHVERKAEAIRAHASQAELMDFAEAALALARWRGELYSWPEGDHAEVFVNLEPLPGP